MTPSLRSQAGKKDDVNEPKRNSKRKNIATNDEACSSSQSNRAIGEIEPRLRSQAGKKKPKRNSKRKNIAKNDGTRRISQSNEPDENTQPLSKRMRIETEEREGSHEINLMNLSFESETNADENIVDDVPIELVESVIENRDEEVEIAATLPTKKRNKFEWKIDSEWENLDDALDFLEAERFVNHHHSDLKCGQKFYFRCKLVPKSHEKWCAKRLILFLPSENMKILILRNQFEHDHDKLLEDKSRPPSDEMEEFLIDLFKCGTVGIAEVLRHIDFARTKRGIFASEPNPKKRQVEYSLQKFRDTQVPKMIKLGDLLEWCGNNSDFPTDINKAFVLRNECSSFDDDLSFRFAISTPLLLEMLSNLETICIDATYKLNWLGFPLIILGTVDRSKRFHPLVYACSTHERTYDYAFVFECVKDTIKTHFNREFLPKKIIADGADPIRNAFYKVFESAELDVMCYAHVLRNCRKRPFTSKNNKQLILDDIQKMQVAPNRPTFEMMSKLFIEKWKTMEPDFAAYFQKEWLGAHCNWFEGAAEYTASTNNGQEGHNAVIKRTITLRRRLPMNQFLACMRDMAENMSKQFSKGERALAKDPTIKKEVFEKAAIMVKENVKTFKAKQRGNLNISVFSVPSSKCEEPTERYYKALVKATWDSFDEFIMHGFQQFYVVKFSNENWKTESTCTCTYFFKQHMCKHVIAIGIRMNIIEVPDTANPVLLAATKRKPGRPKRTAHALRLQN